MTPTERLIASAIARVTYCPGIGTKRFARDMAFLAEERPEHELTPAQRRYLAQVAVRYRRQVPKDVVEAARAMLVEMESA